MQGNGHGHGIQYGHRGHHAGQLRSTSRAQVQLTPGRVKSRQPLPGAVVHHGSHEFKIDLEGLQRVTRKV
jgi:hypothetical protein